MTTRDPRIAGRPHDVAWAVAVGLVAFGVYVTTLAPGLVDIVDTPMFQFVGRALGVPHNPGYPVYVLLTHPFSYLPIGTLAYRINLFSALLGAVAVALVFLAARRLGARPVISAAAALGMAFGQVFWSQAVIAEVYTLDAAFVAAVLLALLAWGGRGGRPPGLLVAALALVAIGFGNRTTILALLPGLLLYVWLENRSMLTRMRSLAIGAGILLSAWAPYVFILIRSRDPHAFLETRATTIGELLAAVSGQQWRDRLFTEGWRGVVADRVPWLFEQVLAPELTVVGLTLALIGVVQLVRTRRAEAGLLLLSWAGYVAFALNYSAVDLPVFLIPAMLILWLALAVGAEAVVGQMPASGLKAAASLALFVVPGWLAVHNYPRVDQRHNTAAAAVFDRLFETLPDGAALVREDFLVDRMVAYKVLGEPPAGRRPVGTIGHDEALEREQLTGRDVFAFTKSARDLRLEGIDVSYEPLMLLDDALPAFLRRLPAGRVVAIAVPSSVAGAFAVDGAEALKAIGAGGRGGVTTEGALAVVGVTGARPGALAPEPAGLGCTSFGARQPLGATGVMTPLAFTVEATATDAAVHIDGRDIVRTEDGAAVVVWEPDGRVLRAVVLSPAHAFRVPIAPGPLSVHRVRGAAEARAVGPAWTPLPGAGGSGSLLLRVPEGSTMVTYVAADTPLAIRTFERGVAGLSVAVTEGGAEGRAAFGHSSGATAAFVYRLEASGPGSALVALGGVPLDLVARASGARAAWVSDVSTAGLLTANDRFTDVLHMTRDDQAQLMGGGWSDVDLDETGPVRWTIGERASVLLPAPAGRLRRIRIQGRLAPTIDLLGVRAFLNGRDLGAHPAVPRWQTYEWDVPEGVARAGTNVLTLTFDERDAVAPSGLPDARLAVSEVVVLHDDPAAPRRPAPAPTGPRPPCS